MRRMLAVMLVLLIGVVASAGCSPASTGGSGSGSTGGSPGASGGSGSGAATSVAVDISGYAYTPSSVTVGVGGTVTWTNADSVAHTVTGDGWGGDVGAGATFSNTFANAGTFAYVCGIHPSMKGEVVVK